MNSSVKKGVVVVEERTDIPFTRFFFHPELCASDNLEKALAVADQSMRQAARTSDEERTK